MPLSLDEVRAQAEDSQTSLGRPHVADAMVARGYVANRDEAFERFLDRTGAAYVGRPAVPLAAGRPAAPRRCGGRHRASGYSRHGRGADRLC